MEEIWSGAYQVLLPDVLFFCEEIMFSLAMALQMLVKRRIMKGIVTENVIVWK